MSLTFNIAVGDTSPSILFALLPTTVDLTGASVQFRWRAINTTTWTNTAAAAIETATETPTLRYDWSPGDTDTAGLYEGQFVVTYADTTVETFPNSAYITVSINGVPDALSQSVTDVRYLVGDTDSALTTQDILFALGQSSNIYRAAAISARVLAARYSKQADTRFETIWSYNSQKAIAFERLARNLDQQAKRAGGLGVPTAGGISISDMESAEAETDRVRPYFRTGQFHNPPAPNAPGSDYED